MVLKASTLSAIRRVRHGFCTRHGGVSQGDYKSLNCGLSTGDQLNNVLINRRLALSAIDGTALTLLTAHQNHGNKVEIVEAPWKEKHRPTADALVTKTSGLAVGVLTADCAPILLADPSAGVVAAIHAGWKGMLAGIVETSVQALIDEGAEPTRTVAAIGPCIAQSSYEVGPEFHSLFLDADSGSQDFFVQAKRDSHFYFDCAGYVARKLDAIDVKKVDIMRYDTSSDPGRFFSYRRSRINGESTFGLSLSAIALVE